MIEAYSIVRLGFGLAAFMVIGFLGTRNKRVAGVLLTFPILNGIALLTDEDPFGVANAIYLVVIFNSVLFCIATTHYDKLPPVPENWSEDAKIFSRLVLWGLMWWGIAHFLTEYRSNLGSGFLLFCIQLAVVALYVRFFWTPTSISEQSNKLAPTNEWVMPFVDFWSNKRAGVRILLFIVAFFFLLYIANTETDPKWIGMASALPLPGLFALATLSVLAKKKDDLLTLRDTILFGPLLVIPFNWSFAALITCIPRDATAFRMLALFGAWAIAFMLVNYTVPLIARRIDQWRTAH